MKINTAPQVVSHVTAFFTRPDTRSARLLGLSLILLMACCCSLRADITTGLITYLKLDETGGLTAADSTGGGHDATLNNFFSDLAQWVAGRTNGALSFDRSQQQYGIIADPGSQLDFSTVSNVTFTFAMWVKGVPGSYQNGTALLGKGGSAGAEQYAIDLVGNNYRFFCRDSSTNTAQGSSDIRPPVGPNGLWQHLVVVFDGSASLTNGGIKFYTNGVLSVQTTNAAPAKLLSSSSLVSLGTREDAIGGFANNFNWNGLVDDFRIYNRALTSNDVMELYLAVGALPPTIVTDVQGFNRFVLESAPFFVTADGTYPLGYQWYYVNTNNTVTNAIAGATNSTFNIAVLQLTNAGSYYVVITNVVGGITSAVASLVVNDLGTNDFTTGMVAYWPFDETSGTIASDATTNGNNATLSNFAGDDSQWVTGRIGRALRLNRVEDSANDKNDLVTAGPMNFPYNNNLITVAWWGRIHSPDNGTQPRMFTPGSLTGAGVPTPGILWRRTGAQSGPAGGSTGVGPNNPRASSSLDYVWKHFVVSWDFTAGTYSLYVNGSPQIINSNGFTRAYGSLSSLVWGIGHQENLTSTGDVDYFRGDMDDMRVYNRLLSASQITALYNNAGPYSEVVTIPSGSVSAHQRDSFQIYGYAASTYAGALSYQWQKNGTNIPGATFPILSTTNLLASDAGTYRLVASNAAAGAFQSPNVVVTVAPAAFGDKTTALSAYWPFDETTGLAAADASGNSHDAALVNFAGDDSQWVPGIIGNALRFNVNNTSNYAIPDFITFSDRTNFSFSFWVKCDNIAQGTNPRIITPQISGQNWMTWYRTAPLGIGMSARTTSPTPLTNVWTHFVMVCNRIGGTNQTGPGIYTLYANGIRVVDQFNGFVRNALPNTGAQFIMGHNEVLATVADFLRGELDDMRIYNRQLNLDDVEALYEMGNLQPQLQVTRAGGNVTIAWSSWAQHFVLQSTDAVLPSGTVWTDVPGTPALSGLYARTLTVSAGGTQKFYRLKHQLP